MSYLPIPAISKYVLLGKLIGADLNTTADQGIAINGSDYIIRRIVITNASAGPTIAQGGIYDNTGMLGNVIVAASQLYTSLASPSIFLDLTLDVYPINNSNIVSSLYLSLTTAEGSALTADVYIFGDRLA